MDVLCKHNRKIIESHLGTNFLSLPNDGEGISNSYRALDIGVSKLTNAYVI